MLDSILGIDPGNNLGTCLIYLDKDLNIKDIETKVYHLDNGIKHEEFFLVERNLYLSEIVKDLLRTNKPLAIGCEDCFKSKFANAVIQLAQYIITIRRTVYEEMGTFKINVMPPKLVKSGIGATGNANKLDMLRAVSNIKDLKKYLRQNITEHEVDAMAIAYLTYLDYKNSIELP